MRSVGILSRYGVFCGIAKQTEYLAPELIRSGVDLTILTPIGIEPSDAHIIPCWREPFGSNDDVCTVMSELTSRHIGVVHVQFEPGIFTRSLRGLLEQIKHAGIRVVLDAHYIDDGIRAYYDDVVDSYVVHASWLSGPRTDVLPLTSPPSINVDLPTARTKYEIQCARTVGFFGFISIQKGVSELVTAVEICRKSMDIGLMIVGSSHPLGSNHDYANQVEQRTANFTWCKWGGYLPNERAALEQLSSCDVIVFPYTTNSRSSSAAAKFALASGRGLVVSESDMFADLTSPIRTTHDPETLAQVLMDLLSSQEKIDLLAASASEEAKKFAPARVAAFYADLYQRV